MGSVEAEGKMTRESGMLFNVADVSKPLASAAKVVEAGNLVVVRLDLEKSFIMNIHTGEKMAIRKEGDLRV